MRVRVVLEGGILVEVDNTDWHKTKPNKEHPVESRAAEASDTLIDLLNTEFPSGEFPPDRPLERAREAINNEFYGGRITGTIEEPLNLPEGAIH